ncbi:MAG: hypothetical protein NC338_02470 [Firmicutes bacterium]|nr:hypothetical protein [Bacillota bacterium]MCM1400698.1 hypothetical protein [Bacteroides sp.]MCM1476392.1 hypothetical protein [Bacteroides sp.]
MDSIRDNSFFPRQFWLLAVNIGLVLIVVATALPLFQLQTGLPVKILYTAGAAIVVLARIFAPSAKGASLRVRRLCRLEIWSGIIFCAGAFFMWYSPGNRDWLAFTLAGAALQIYTSVAIPRVVAAESADKTSEKQRKNSSYNKKH